MSKEIHSPGCQEAYDALPRDSALSSLTSLASAEHDRRTFLKAAAVPCAAACVASCLGGWPSLAFGGPPPAGEDSRFVA